MVDTGDLKSPDPKGRAGSIPARATIIINRKDMKQILIASIAVVTILVIATLIALHAVFSDKKDIDEVEEDGTDIIRGADYDIDKIFMSQQHIHMS